MLLGQHIRNFPKVRISTVLSVSGNVRFANGTGVVPVGTTFARNALSAETCATSPKLASLQFSPARK